MQQPYKKIETEISKEEGTMTLKYWNEEDAQGEPDHTLLIKVEQLNRNYVHNLYSICPECVARGVYSPMQRNVIHGINPSVPLAVIDTCISCGLKNNGLFYYWEQ